MAAAPILSKCCLLNTNTSSLTLLKEDAHTDATFLISSILGHRLRVSTSAIILVCTHQNFQHYSQAGQRLGYNLKQGNNLLIIDLCNGIGDQLESACVSENLIAKLWQQIEAGVLDAKKNSTIDKITIIIDDLIFFKLFGFTDNHLIKLVELLAGLSARHTDLTVSVVVKVSDFPANSFVCHHIEERAHVVLDVERLKSGNFKQVDGHILVRTSENSGANDGLLAGKNMFGQQHTTTTGNYDNGKKILYKINDRNVKIFMPGEHGLGGLKI